MKEAKFYRQHNNIIEFTIKNFNSKEKSDIDYINSRLFYFTYYNYAAELEYLFEKLPSLLKYLESIGNSGFDGDVICSIPNESCSIFHHAISNNAIDSMEVFHKQGLIFMYNHIEYAIKNHAESSVKYLLSHTDLSSVELYELAKLARKLGNVNIVNMIMPEDNIFYFRDALEEGNIQEKVAMAYRFSNIGAVDHQIKHFIIYIKQHRPEIAIPIQDNILHQRKIYLEWGTQIAKYRKPRHRKEINRVYTNSTLDEFDIQSEINFGMKNFSVVENILKKDSLEQKLPEKFLENFPLPDDFTGPKEFLHMRDLVNIVSENHFQEAVSRGNENAHLFREIRWMSISTPFYRNRYEHCRNLALAAFKFSQENKQDFINDNDFGYTITYQGRKLSHVYIFIRHQLAGWMHGNCEIKDLWPCIEKATKAAFELQKEEIEKKPDLFYNNVIEAIWLNAHVTPLTRGTGRLNEISLAVFHKKHNFSLPILKPEWQLDCINLTLPLPHYQKLWWLFFEPETLEPAVLKYYMNLYNTDDEIRRLAERYQLFPPLELTSTKNMDEKGSFKNWNISEFFSAKITDDKASQKQLHSKIETMTKEHLIDLMEISVSQFKKNHTSNRFFTNGRQSTPKKHHYIDLTKKVILKLNENKYPADIFKIIRQFLENPDQNPMKAVILKNLNLLFKTNSLDKLTSAFEATRKTEPPEMNDTFEKRSFSIIKEERSTSFIYVQ